MRLLLYATAAFLVVASTALIATTGESILVRYLAAVVTVALVVKLVDMARHE
ncbi:MAG: hypothetical protein QOJ69_1535 [Actinomycetota bacterium]|jgi:hypothetical protein|nr:hypothetical protein [Actinomycetota bacterium]